MTDLELAQQLDALLVTGRGFYAPRLRREEMAAIVSALRAADELRAEIAASMVEITSLRKDGDEMFAAFLAYVQPTNECDETGEPCGDEPRKCGCWLETENAIDAYRTPALASAQAGTTAE